MLISVGRIKERNTKIPDYKRGQRGASKLSCYTNSKEPSNGRDFMLLNF